MNHTNMPDSYNLDTGHVFQIMDKDGNIVRPDLVPDWNDLKLREIYEAMLFLRLVDKQIINLQRQGRCGTYVSVEGQEACQLGSGLALDKKTDWVFPAFRELVISYVHGVPLEKIILYWMGNEWGSNYDANVAPVSIPVGTHPLHAAGYAWGLKMQNKPGVTVSYFGDGATSTGDFYEAMNFAGIFKLPTIFFCQNNQWAISTPRAKQTAAKTLAQKAIAAEVTGVQVDGNDVFAVYKIMQDAVTRAREGKGATLIEAVTYRYGDHTTSDNALRYRPQEDVEKWRPLDPFLRLKKYMRAKNIWDEDFEKKIIADAEPKIRAAVEAAENTPPPSPEEMFDYLFEKPTPALKEQKKSLLESLTPNA